jgi:hypothetical protein
MDNYFISYNKGKQSYIIPEVNTIPNIEDLRAKRVSESIAISSCRATERFNPHTRRISHPIALEAFVIGPSNLFYEVIEGLYMLSDGTMKLKVRTKYGQ